MTTCDAISQLFLLSNATALNHTPRTDQGHLPVELNSTG